MSNPNTRKSCIVKKCKNTTINSPEKLFFLVPRNFEMRNKWMQAANRADQISAKSSVYCCEDHFEIETDMENYIKYKLVGGNIRLKNGIVPHKFECQQEQHVKPKRSAEEKPKQLKNIEKRLSKDEYPSTSTLDATVKIEQVILPSHDDDPLSFEKNDRCLKISTKDQAVQVKLKEEAINKSTMTEEKYFKDEMNEDLISHLIVSACRNISRRTRSQTKLDHRMI